MVLGLSSLCLGCSLDGLLKNDQLPPDVTDPAVTKTPAGAMATYAGTVRQLQRALGGRSDNNITAPFVAVTGALSDELEQPTGSDVTGIDPVNQRAFSGLATDANDVQLVYSSLNRTRSQAGQAINLLAQYVPEQPAFAGHMYAIEAYAEIMLAELFCSGIPLSTIDYNGDYTYRPGSSTEQVFTHALALLDTGLTAAADSARFVNLIRVAQGRALLALGQYAAAGAAVTAVPDGYQYLVSYDSVIGSDGNDPRNFAADWANTSNFNLFGNGVADFEGGTGLNYRTSGDPRTPSTQVVGAGFTAYRANKYATTGETPIVLASGVEARLIQAEAALQAGDGAWLTTLNALRTDGTFDTTATSPPDTLWHAGSGGVAGLRPLDDPGASLSGAAADSARVDLVFRERAFWLFLTGHRQGDLRRLIRQYGRSDDDVYPTGAYPVVGNFYGTDVVAPIPRAERLANPLFTGCFSTGA